MRCAGHRISHCTTKSCHSLILLPNPSLPLSLPSSRLSCLSHLSRPSLTLLPVSQQVTLEELLPYLRPTADQTGTEATTLEQQLRRYSLTD